MGELIAWWYCDDELLGWSDKFTQISSLSDNSSWRRMRLETSFCGVTRTHMGPLNQQTEGQLMRSPLSWVKMKFDEWLFLPWFERSKKTNLALVSNHISIGQRAIGLPMGGLDSHTSQHYSPHDKAQSLLNGQAGLGIKSENARKSILFVAHNGTTGSGV